MDMQIIFLKFSNFIKVKKIKYMFPTKSFAALSATTPLEAYSFDRRAVGKKDVQIELVKIQELRRQIEQEKREVSK